MSENFSFNKPDLEDEEIIEYINKRENITTIAFVSPYSGIPHMCPVWGIFHRGRYFFQSDDYLAKTKSIEKGNDKIGISVTDPSQYPDYSENEIPYISFGGKALIRRKNEFEEFEEILMIIFLKYFLDKKTREKVFKFVMEEVKTRVLIEVIPEWIKARKIPLSEDS
ncbi:MAG: hypothetical protein HGN29_09845 [Asgard group archaeon]|nr:hypothetical protein [Asgard group archaeon]